MLHLLYARFWHKVLFDLGHVSTPEPFQRLFNQGYIQAARVHRRRAALRRGERGRGARRRFFYGDDEVHARVREDGQEPEERGRARRHLPRLRRRHAAALRDVHGSARREPPVEHLRHRRRAPVPAAALAQRDRRGHRRRARRPRRRPTTRPAAAAPHDRRGACDMGDLALQHRGRPADRAEQPADPGRRGDGRGARGGRRAAGADDRAARSARRRGALGAARPRRDARLRGLPGGRSARGSWSRRSRSRSRSTARCGRGRGPGGTRRAATEAAARGADERSPRCSRVGRCARSSSCPAGWSTSSSAEDLPPCVARRLSPEAGRGSPRPEVDRRRARIIVVPGADAGGRGDDARPRGSWCAAATRRTSV